MSKCLLSLELPNKRSRRYDRPVIMGILNVTPDSFSDGGAYDKVDIAFEHAKQMLLDGADVIDVGGESTRPGSKRVDGDEQIRRVVPVIQALSQQVKEVVISIDTTLVEVAQAAIEAGAVMINDISAGRDDPAMFSLAARCGAPLFLMHMQGGPDSMQENPKYEDVVAEVTAFLLDTANKAIAAGVRREHILIDPGIGFGKTIQHNIELLAHLDQLVATGYPVLLGTSRKHFLSQITKSTPLTWDREAGTCATTALGVAQGVCVFRVHDVRTNRQAADIAWAIGQAKPH